MPKLPTSDSKTRKDRVEYIRNYINHDGVRQYVTLLDNAITLNELHTAEKRESELIPDEKDLQLATRYCLSEAAHENEDRIRRAAKQADKDRIAAKKADKLTAATTESEVLKAYLQYPMLREAITTVSESFRPDLIQSFYHNRVTRITRFIIGNRLNVPEPIWEGRGKYASTNHYKRQAYENNLQFIKPYHNNNILKPNYLEIIQQQAEEYADLVLEGLRAKLAGKLGPVIDRKGGGAIEPHGNVDRHIIRITFPDNSGFTIQSQIVHAVSKNGVFFSRHPLTFHNVIFEDGTRMQTPSADRMQKEFGIDITTKE